MYSLPTEITLGEESFRIRDKGDFRMVLNVFEVLEDIDLSKDERYLTALILFYEDIDCFEDLVKIPDKNEAIQKMFEFLDCGEVHTEQVKKPKLIDWSQDSNLICAAINNVAGKEVRAESYIHWWTFMGYFMSIGESSLSTVISIRNKILRGKKLEKHESDFRNENPHYFVWNSQSVEDRADEQWLKDVWNSNPDSSISPC